MNFSPFHLKCSLAAIFMASAFIFSAVHAEENESETSSIAVVNVRQCIENSKLGQQGRETLSKTQKQMDEVLEKMNTELGDVSAKFSDTDYLDSLTPEVEKDLRSKFMNLSKEKSQFENQYYQIMNQANTQFIQSVLNGIGKASKEIAASKGLQVIVDSETCFFYRPTIDLTHAVLAKMDRHFEENEAETSEVKEIPE